MELKKQNTIVTELITTSHYELERTKRQRKSWRKCEKEGGRGNLQWYVAYAICIQLAQDNVIFCVSMLLKQFHGF